MEEDVGVAIDTVRNHFLKTQTVYSFEINKAELVEKEGKKYWDIQCSFFKSILDEKKVRYSVLVSVETNHIYRIAEEGEQ